MSALILLLLAIFADYIFRALLVGVGKPRSRRRR